MDLFPPIKESQALPIGTMFLFAPRKPNESVEDWAKRCAVIYNVGTPVKEGAD